MPQRAMVSIAWSVMKLQSTRLSASKSAPGWNGYHNSLVQRIGVRNGGKGAHSAPASQMHAEHKHEQRLSRAKGQGAIPVIVASAAPMPVWVQPAKQPAKLRCCSFLSVDKWPSPARCIIAASNWRVQTIHRRIYALSEHPLYTIDRTAAVHCFENCASKICGAVHGSTCISRRVGCVVVG